jgi:CBS domain-containing protein
MTALPETYGDISKKMAFDDAKSNFFRAARHGLEAHFHWIDGRSYSATSLILDHLLPIAREGLTSAQVATADIDKYLGIIQERAQSRQTGARWITKSVSAIGSSLSKDACQRRLTSEILANQKLGEPIHRWSPIEEEPQGDEWEHGYRTVGQFMSTDLFTVNPEDLIDFAASVMDWRHIRHVPVEDGEGRLVGLVTHRGVLRIISNGNRSAKAEPVTVRDVMVANPVTVSPTTSSLEAIEIMRRHRVGCLPVVTGDQLVGIVTSYDFLEASARLFKQHMTPRA